MALEYALLSGISLGHGVPGGLPALEVAWQSGRVRLAVQLLLLCFHVWQVLVVAFQNLIHGLPLLLLNRCVHMRADPRILVPLYRFIIVC